MASVSSLDQDMRRLRLDRYTPAAANEIRTWIENSLGEKLAPGDLMEALRNGVALCKLVNLCVSPGVKYKASSMPFVQMENISHFLKACEMPPISLPAHDRFLTVDLFDQKDPAQVLQCIAAFSRRANQVNPSKFPNTIGAKSKGGTMSPENTESGKGYTVNTPPKHEPQTAFNPLNKAAYSSGGRTSPTKTSSLSRGGLATGGPVSSWSKASDENNTAPAWNIHQYGYMGGASQGNQGVAFGARRQIISQAPEVPSLAEKEKRLREQMEQAKRDNETQQQREKEAQEEEERIAREEEERKWAEETRKLKEEEQQQQHEERMRREEVEREAQEERNREAAMKDRREQQRQPSDSRLNGQFLSQYRSSQETVNKQPTAEKRPVAAEITKQPTAESLRIAELERQLAEAKAAEKQYWKIERQRVEEDELSKQKAVSETAIPYVPSRSEPQTSNEDDWDASEREFLQKQHAMARQIEAEERPLPKAPRPTQAEPITSRPLPDPTIEPYRPGTNRTGRFLSSNPAPQPATIRSNRPDDFSTTTEVDLEDQRRITSQTQTKAGGWASKSLLEREMERERERQREWEEEQKQTAARSRDVQEGAGPGQTWDVHQYGYMGGDSQNRGGTGLGTSGARRQIIGPRPLQ